MVKPRISLTFISLTCLVGMMMLVTISRYGSGPVGEMVPIGKIRNHPSKPSSNFQNNIPSKSNWQINNRAHHVNSVEHQTQVWVENDNHDNSISSIYSGSKSSPIKVSNNKKWFIPGNSDRRKVQVMGKKFQRNPIVLDYQAHSNNNGGQSFPIARIPSTAIPISSSSFYFPLSSKSSSTSSIISIESTKKPAIISSTSSTGLLKSELDFSESNSQQSQPISSSSNNLNQLLLQPASSSFPSSDVKMLNQGIAANPIPSSSQSSSPGPMPILSSTPVTGNVSKQIIPFAVTPAPPTKPKITFDWEDLETTDKFVINKLNFCDEDNGATTDLLVIIASAVTHFEARDAIRKTWGGFAIERGAKLVFLLGSPAPWDETSYKLIQNQVNQEDSIYGDILQGSFIDNYYNLTLKSISMLQWVNETCDAVKYVLKIDDDMFVNMQMMVDFSETRTFSKVIIGKLARKWRPHHDPKSKWYVPSSAFNGTIFPNFATGPAYIFTGDATKYLLETALTSTPIYLEDVYVTGIVAEKAGVRRLNHALMKNVRLKVDACTFKRFITSHQHSPKEILHLWKIVYEPPIQNCTVIKSSVATSHPSPQQSAAIVASAQAAVAQLRQQQQQQRQGAILPPLPPTGVRSPSSLSSVLQPQPQVQPVVPAAVQSPPSLTIQLPSSSAKLNLNLMKVVNSPPSSLFQQQQQSFPINLNPVPPVKIVHS